MNDGCDLFQANASHSFFFTLQLWENTSRAKNWNTSAESLVIKIPWCTNMQSVSSLTNAENWDNMESYCEINSGICE